MIVLLAAIVLFVKLLNCILVDPLCEHYKEIVAAATPFFVEPESE